MGLLFVESLPFPPNVLRCGLCWVDIASQNAIVPKNVFGRTGHPAFLVNSVVNVVTSSQIETRNMLTRPHDVSDIHCISCHQLLGWKFVRVRGKGLEFTEGTYLLESHRVVEHSR